MAGGLCGYACEFLRSAFAAGPIRWSRLRPGHVREFVAGSGRMDQAAAARAAAGSAASSADSSSGVDRVRIGRRDAPIPAVAARHLAALPDGRPDRPAARAVRLLDGRWDYAIAVCLVDLGLRVGRSRAGALISVDRCQMATVVMGRTSTDARVS